MIVLIIIASIVISVFIIDLIVAIICNLITYFSLKRDLMNIRYDNDLKSVIHYYCRNIHYLSMKQLHILFDDFKKEDIWEAFYLININLTDYIYHFNEVKTTICKLLLYLNDPSYEVYDTIQITLPKKLYQIYIKPYIMDDMTTQNFSKYRKYLSNEELLEYAISNQSVYIWCRINLKNKKLLKNIEFVRKLKG